MTDATAPNAVIVLGMHRSGTSAVAGALGVLGVALGSRLVAAAADNPKGYWEHADAVQLHETLLAALGSAWEDPRELPADWLQGDAARAASAAASALIGEEFAAAPLWALKDPRQCRLLPAWHAAFTVHGIRPAYLLVVRDPAEVAASLQQRNDLSPEHAAMLWARHLFDVDRDTGGAPRALLSYGRLLADPVAAFDTVAARLGVTWPLAPAACGAELAAFVDAGMRHQRGVDSGPASAVMRLAQEAYRRCLQAEADGQWPALADLRTELASASPALSGAVPGLVRAIADERQRHAALAGRLLQTDRALAQTTSLSLQRLDQVREIDARLARTDAALAEASRLSLERMDELQRLHAQLLATDQALEATKQLSLQRLAETEAQASRAERAEARAEQGEARVQAMVQSRSWRLTRPLRVLARWWRRVLGPRDRP